MCTQVHGHPQKLEVLLPSRANAPLACSPAFRLGVAPQSGVLGPCEPQAGDAGRGLSGPGAPLVRQGGLPGSWPRPWGCLPRSAPQPLRRGCRHPALTKHGRSLPLGPQRGEAHDSLYCQEPKWLPRNLTVALTHDGGAGASGAFSPAANMAGGRRVWRRLPALRRPHSRWLLSPCACRWSARRWDRARPGAARSTWWPRGTRSPRTRAT